jgi:hypothetical protein
MKIHLLVYCLCNYLIFCWLSNRARIIFIFLHMYCEDVLFVLYRNKNVCLVQLNNCIYASGVCIHLNDFCNYSNSYFLIFFSFVYCDHLEKCASAISFTKPPKQARV